MDKVIKKRIVRRNFLEQLREIGLDVETSVKKDVIKGVVKAGVEQIIGTTQGNIYESPRPIEEIEKAPAQWTKQEFTNIVQQERSIFKRAEQEVRLEIEAVRTEIVKLIKTVKGMSREVEIAAMQAPVEPGSYHLNFLEKLRETVIFLTKNIRESFNWLSVCNQRAKKRGHYWSQVHKSGTKFMLSQERYMATQAG